MTIGAAPMVTLEAALAVVVASPASAAVTVNAKTPPADGVPVSAPLEPSNDTPGGSEPAASVQMNPPEPPLAPSAAAYATVMRPAGSAGALSSTGEQAMVTLNGASTTLVASPASVTRTEKLLVPAAVAV